MQNTNIHTSRGREAKHDSSLLLSLHNTKNLDLIRDFLPDDLVVDVHSNGMGNKEFDLCILDELSLQNNKVTVRKIKDRVAPIFLPILLLTTNAGNRAGQVEFFEYVDDVLTIPTSSSLLESRIRMLLRQRTYSLKLEEKNRELAAKNRELEEEKQKYQLLTEHSTDMISRHRPDSTYLYISPSVKEIMGYNPEELTGQQAHDYFHPDDFRRIRDNHESILGTADTAAVAYRLRRKDGSYRWVETRSKAVRDLESDDLVEIQASTRDISERKQYEEELHDTLYSLQERVKEQACLYNIASLSDEKKTVESLLNEAVKLLPQGFQFAEITEAAIQYEGTRYATEGYRETEWNLTATSSIATDAPLQVIIVYTEERAVFADAVFLSEEQKLIDSIADTVSKQIDRIRSSRELQISNERWKKLVRNDSDLIQLSTAEGMIKFVNEAGVSLYGYDRPEEVIGKNYFDLLHFRNPEIAHRRISKILEGEDLPPQVYKVTNRHGNDLYLKLRSVPVTLADGEVGLQQVAQDITERIVYERQLEESLKEKNVLLQEIHHRVKNNLAVVSGLLKLQRFNSSSRELERILSHCEMRIKSMALIHETLYQSESLSNINFRDYIGDLTENITNILGAHADIKLASECTPFYLNINQAIPCGLIISELVSNALEHAFEPGHTGQVTIGAKLNDDNEVHVSVEDNGKGMPEDILQQESHTMGFTIIKTLIRQLDTTLHITRDNGSTVSFSFVKQQVSGSGSNIPNK